jgi:hypothetical protein
MGFIRVGQVRKNLLFGHFKNYRDGEPDGNGFTIILASLPPGHFMDDPQHFPVKCLAALLNQFNLTYFARFAHHKSYDHFDPLSGLLVFLRL